MEREKLRALTGVRFLAAFCVVVFHALGFIPGLLPVGSAGYAVFHSGYLGVNFFFLLSGFILSYKYLAPSGSMRGSSANFWIARFARIYPVYVIGLLLDAIPYAMRQRGVTFTVIDGITHPLLLQSWIPFYTWPHWNPPDWSISNEAFFYLVFPALLLVMSRKRSGTLWLFLVLGWSISILAPLALVSVLPTAGSHDYILQGFRSALVVYFPLFRLPEFFIGMAAGLLFLRAQQHTSSSRHSYRDPLLLLLLAALFIFILPIQTATPSPSAYLADPIFLLMIVLLASSRGIVAALLGSKVFVELGEVSYGIYILHFPIWAWIVLLGINQHITGWQLFLPYLFLLLAVALFSYHIIERPLRHRIRLIWSRRQDRAKDLQRLASRAHVGQRG